MTVNEQDRGSTPGRLEEWEKRVEWPLAALAFLFLAAYSVEVLAQPHGRGAQAIGAVTLITYLAFAIDYVVRLRLAPNRWGWFYRHLLDLAVVVLPLLRPLRLLRLVMLVLALQRAIGTAIRGRVIVYTAAGITLLVYVASLAVLQYERPHPEAHISTFGEALWWSITTVTTVGYGDTYPITTAGRIIAALLMIGGIGLVGSITATLASWIVQRVAQEDTAGQVATAAHIDELRDEIRQLAEAVRLATARESVDKAP